MKTIRQIQIVILILLFLFPIAFSIKVQSEIFEKAPQQKYQQTIKLLDSLIQREMTDKELGGVAIALVDNQQIVWQKGFGFSNPQTKMPITTETVFRVGSVSKLFTDIAIMRLVEQGKVDLDAPITNYLPDFKPKNPFNKPITLRQLMSHRAGLVREPPIGSYFDSVNSSLADSVKSLNQTFLVYAPETRTKYSNAGVATVGYVLEKTQKQAFADYLKQNLLDPLGMKQSDFKPSSNTIKNLAKAEMWTVFGKTFEAPTFELGIAPAGSMYTTTGDLSRFASAVFAADDKTNSVLKKSTLEKMWQPQYAAPNQKNGFGIGFAVSDLDGHREVGHGGAIYGFSTQLSLLPDDKLGVVVISTKDFSNGVTSRIAELALKAMLAEKENKPVEQPEPTLPIDANLAKKLAGRFTSGDKTIDMTKRGNILSAMDVKGGYEVRLRSHGNALIADDKFTFGTRIIPSSDGNSFSIGDKIFKRINVSKPLEVSKNLRGLIGEYGPDYDTLNVFERDGKLWVLIEQFEYDQLDQVSENVFNFPKSGLYDGEQVVFKRDKSGKATEVMAANVSFKRRNIEPESGNQLFIKPLRPVPELIKEALTATPPTESGDFYKTDLVELTKLDPTIKLEVRYATKNNLFGTVFYSQAKAFLQRPAAEAVARANQKLKKLGYGLLIHDGYRPWYVTKTFWDATPDEKKIFVANPAQGSR
ncbi:MAG TPA: serine hydrolase, partial [Pyrinomonadaceae bacterium]|nr:serine hydrolase [Pyrinomonadaceae bacterium]